MKWQQVLLGLAVAGCADTGGRIDMTWSGADTGRFRAPAIARWCANDSVIEVIGTRGDSGFALALFPRDTIHAGTYPLSAPVKTPSRPGARVALRWADRTFIEGYYSISGAVTVNSGSRVGGTMEGTLKSIQGGGQITVTGTFRDLSIQAGSAGACGVDSTAVTVPVPAEP